MKVVYSARAFCRVTSTRGGHRRWCDSACTIRNLL